MNYIQTFTGAKVHVPFVNPEEIVLADIAHALSNACRFAGHTKIHWSVAKHSLCVANLVPGEHKKQALVHDATEAYLCDIPTPYKRVLPAYEEMEQQLWSIIAQRLNVPVELHPLVKEADRIMLMTERDALCTTSRDWGELEETRRVPDLIEVYKEMTAEETEQMFLKKFMEYSGV